MNEANVPLFTWFSFSFLQKTTTFPSLAPPPSTPSPPFAVAITLFFLLLSLLRPVIQFGRKAKRFKTDNQHDVDQSFSSSSSWPTVTLKVARILIECAPNAPQSQPVPCRSDDPSSAHDVNWGVASSEILLPFDCATRKVRAPIK